MLAGCSPVLLSNRNRLSFQLEEKMGTQRFDIPCSGFSRKDGRHVALWLENLAETRTSCSFRQNSGTPSSSSIVAQTASWEGRREIEEVGTWHRGKSLKRFYERSSSEEDSLYLDRSKRKRTGGDAHLVGGGDADSWLPRPIAVPPLLEEEKVYFMPNAAICSHALLESFGTEVVNSGERSVGTSEGLRGRTNFDSNSSSDTHGSSRKLHEESPENVTGNGFQVPQSSGVAGIAALEENIQLEHQGFELVSLLTSCAESISSGNHAAINYFLARLGELASPMGSSIHRVAAYFTEALAIRVVKLWPHIFSIATLRELADQIDEDDATAVRLLNYVSPIPKFLHFTMNERVLRAFEEKDRVHIIDFDIKQGLQWPSLFQSLASRPSPPSCIRITGIGQSKQDLQDTGARLAGFAEALNIPFEFHPVVDRLEDVRLWMLHVKEGECVAVNCVLLLKTLYNESGDLLRNFLGLIRGTNPSIVVIAEEEAKHNDSRWDTRFAKSLKYYSSIFDSLDASLPMDSPSRNKIEEMFARRIRNIVACEGVERVERHEVFNKWRRMISDGGFCNVRIRERETLQSNILLRMYSCENYSIEVQGEDDAGLTLKWLDQPLYTVSAWAPSDIAGSSSTSQPG